MTAPLRIFIGYDPREHLAYEVAKWSIERRASVSVLVTPLVLSHLAHILTRPVVRRDDKLWCPISQAPMSTEFAISRFCIPFLQWEGWALYVDCDILCLGDVADLFALADNRYAVQVVKHGRLPAAGTKMDGQEQTAYPRKNWSSVVLWNCGDNRHSKLTRECLNSWPGRDLHAFAWLADDAIGDLPHGYNWLVGVQKRPSIPFIWHYTLGGPWLQGWCDSPWDYAWNYEKQTLYRPVPDHLFSSPMSPRYIDAVADESCKATISHVDG